MNFMPEYAAEIKPTYFCKLKKKNVTLQNIN
jgi:hypothetical protein